MWSQRNDAIRYIVITTIVTHRQTATPVNIARGTTDPEIDSMTWTKLGNNMAPLALVANLATRWRHLHSLQRPPDSAT